MNDRHICDPHLVDGSGGGPLTLSRALRFVLATLDDVVDGGDNAEVVRTEFMHCHLCCVAVAAGAAGAAASAINRLDELGHSPRPKLEALLSWALDDLAREGKQ